MDFITGLIPALLTLVGYSSGSVLGAKRRTSVPNIADLLVITVMWIIVFATRNSLSKWSAIGMWLVIGLVLGAVFAWARADSYPKAQPLDTSSGLWNAWKGFARQMGNYQSRVLMAFVYFAVVLPFGLGVMFFGDPLKIKRAHSDSNWQPKEFSLKPSIDEARSQF